MVPTGCSRDPLPLAPGRTKIAPSGKASMQSLNGAHSESMEKRASPSPHGDGGGRIRSQASQETSATSGGSGAGGLQARLHHSAFHSPSAQPEGTHRPGSNSGKRIVGS